jgi:hypothetical protein
MYDFIEVTTYGDGRKFGIRKNEISLFKEEDWKPKGQDETVRSVTIYYGDDRFVRIKEKFNYVFDKLYVPEDYR